MGDIMKYLTTKEYQQELEKVKRENVQKKYKQSLKNEKNKYRKSFKIETSKLIAFYLFALLNAIVVYAMVAMWIFADISYLGVLISDIAAQIMIYAIYCMKAYRAKKSEEEMKFKRDKYSGSLENILSAGAECKDEIVGIINNIENTEYQTENTDESIG